MLNNLIKDINTIKEIQTLLQVEYQRLEELLYTHGVPKQTYNVIDICLDLFDEVELIK